MKEILLREIRQISLHIINIGTDNRVSFQRRIKANKMVIFDSFRDPGWNTYYGDRPKMFVSFDLSMAIVTYVSVVIAAAMAMIVIGSRGKERWITFLRLLVSVHTGVMIIVCVVGRYWQVSKVHSHSEFKAGVLEDIETDIGIRVGLKDVNITLHAETELIDYNEEFSLHHFREIRSSYREGLERGLPRPILHSLEYFYVDGGGLRWYRALRNAGHFTYILLWTSLVTWLISNILLCFIISRGMLMLMLTGSLMVAACLVYHCMQSVIPLAIPFSDGVLRLHYGWCYWLCLGSGIVACLNGIVFLFLNWHLPDTIKRIFLSEYSPLEEQEASESSPGPLKIDTPFSRRTARVIQRTTGTQNRGFLLDDWLAERFKRSTDDPSDETYTKMFDETVKYSSTTSENHDLNTEEVNMSSSRSSSRSRPRSKSRSRTRNPDSIVIKTDAVIESRRIDEDPDPDPPRKGSRSSRSEIELEFVDANNRNDDPSADDAIFHLDKETIITPVESSC